MRLKIILISIVISGLLFNFENKSSIFSRNIHLRKKSNTSLKTEDSAESEKFLGFYHHNNNREHFFILKFGKVNSSCSKAHISEKNSKLFPFQISKFLFFQHFWFRVTSFEIISRSLLLRKVADQHTLNNKF